MQHIMHLLAQVLQGHDEAAAHRTVVCTHCVGLSIDERTKLVGTRRRAANCTSIMWLALTNLAHSFVDVMTFCCLKVVTEASAATARLRAIYKCNVD